MPAEPPGIPPVGSGCGLTETTPTSSGVTILISRSFRKLGETEEIIKFGATLEEKNER